MPKHLPNINENICPGSDLYENVCTIGFIRSRTAKLPRQTDNLWYLLRKRIITQQSKETHLQDLQKCAGLAYMDPQDKEKQVKTVSIRAKWKTNILGSNFKAPHSTK